MGFHNPFRTPDGPSLESPDSMQGRVRQVKQAITQQTTQQVKAANQSFVDQLYGNTSAADATQMEQSMKNQQSNPVQPPQGSQNVQSQNLAEMAGKTPDEQKKIAETQTMIRRLHKENYFDYEQKTVSDEAILAANQQKEQERHEKEQAEEEERQQKAEVEARKKEAMEATEPSGKHAKAMGNGRKRAQMPIALSRAKTRTEMNRGASG